MTTLAGEATAQNRSSESALRMLLRAAAVLIAIAAAIDPAISSERRGKPIVSVVPSDAVQDRALAARVADALDDEFTVLHAPFASADAVILAGDRLRTDLERSGSVFSVHSRASMPRIQSVGAPIQASVHAPVRVNARLFAPGSGARSISAELQVNGAVMDQQRYAFDANQQHTLASLTFVPTDTGIASLRVIARSGNDSSFADVVVGIHDRPLSVLVYDPRPAYSSTFVRRALERDPRLTVTSRVVTSRGISTSTGAAPAQLSNASALSSYDAVVIGAPDALSAGDVSALQAYMRTRGGSVVLLLDNQMRGPFEQLAGVRNWSFRSVDRGAVARLSNGEPDQLRVSSQFWPATLPVGATVLAQAASTRTDSLLLSDDASPVIWSLPVGNGQLVVSGALDAWRYRDAEVSQFDRVFTQLIANAAAAAMPAVSVSMEQNALAPRESTPFTISLRDASSASETRQPFSANVSAVVSHADSLSSSDAPVRLFPGASPGTFRGTLRAPTAVGGAQLIVNANGERVSTPLVVSDTRQHPLADEPALLDAWIASRGGWSIEESAIATLAGRLQSSLAAAPRTERWHPMRSVWWLVPFALLLSVEWWLRRRRGLP